MILNIKKEDLKKIIKEEVSRLSGQEGASVSPDQLTSLAQTLVMAGATESDMEEIKRKMEQIRTSSVEGLLGSE